MQDHHPTPTQTTTKDGTSGHGSRGRGCHRLIVLIGPSSRGRVRSGGDGDGHGAGAGGLTDVSIVLVLRARGRGRGRSARACTRQVPGNSVGMMSSRVTRHHGHDHGSSTEIVQTTFVLVGTSSHHQFTVQIYHITYPSLSVLVKTIDIS